MNTVTITGNTYPVRDALRSLGGTWNARAKGWDVPADKADEARAIVSGAPTRGREPRARRGRGSYGSNYARFAGGAEVFTNARGRCEDAPCCGCCS